jgi:Flp pilus assembly protein TadD
LCCNRPAFLHAGHRGILSEYGRLALEPEQVELAQKLLGEADDPANAELANHFCPGTVLAKQGKYREAIPLYEPALALTMEGKAEQAEGLLKQAVVHGGHEVRLNHSLALVLSGQASTRKPNCLAPAGQRPSR